MRFISIILNKKKQVNAPMAPPEAMAKKHQRLRKYGDYGICIDTSSRVHDVPLTDCFYLDDRLLVQSTEDGGIILTSRFEIRFIKSTMFRRIIERTTKDEFLKWADRFRKLLADSIPDKADVEKTSTDLAPAISSPRLDATRLVISSDVAFFLIVLGVLAMLCLHVCLLLEIKSLGNSIKMLDVQVNKLVESNSRICMKDNN